jgi:hypothetical protein
MKNIKYIFFAIASVLFLYNCEDTLVPDTDYTTFEASSIEFGIDPEGTGSLEVSVFATKASSSERQLTIAVVEDATDATGYTVPNFVIIPAGQTVGSFTVTANGSDIDPANGNTITVEITDADGSFFGGPVAINLKQVCPYPELLLNISFDSYPEEQYFEIYDMSDNLLIEGGTFPGESTLATKFCLAPGQYQFLMGDTYGDGGGAYTLTYNGSVIHSSDGDYGFGEVIVITLN